MSHLSSSSSSEPSLEPSQARSGQKRHRSHSATPPATKTPRAASVTTPHTQKYSKLFVETDDLPTSTTFSKFIEMLHPNAHARKIINVARSKDNSGFILTFKSHEEAEAFLKTPFNNNLDFSKIRYTKKPNLRCDVLIHNISPSISEEEIKQEIENNLNIKLFSVYRLTRQVRQLTATQNLYNGKPVQYIPTNTVKITINQRDEKHFENYIVLFTYNRCRTSRPPPPPVVAQCLKCFQFNHSTEQCTQRFDTCKLCGGPHALASCTKSIDDKKCVNCSENHLPTYKGCPIYKHTFKIAREIKYKSYAQATAHLKQQNIIDLQEAEMQKHTSIPQTYSFTSPPKPRSRPNIVPPPQSQLRTPDDAPNIPHGRPRPASTRRATKPHTPPHQHATTTQEGLTIFQDILNLINAFKQTPVTISAIITPITNIIKQLLQFYNNQQLETQAFQMCPIL